MLLLLALSVNCTYANVDSNDTVANLTNTTAIQVLTDNSTLNGTNTSNNTTTTNNSVSNGTSDGILKTNEKNVGNTTNANTKNTTSTNTENITNTVTNQVNNENSVNSAAAAGEIDYSNVHGIWVATGDALSLNVNELLNANITDVFVKSNIYSNPTYQTVLSSVLAQLNDTGIRVHAWITCFMDANGNWIDPQSSAGQSHEDEVIAAIENIVKNYDVAGTHLDYVRYSGVESKNQAAYQNNETAATNAVTSFVEKVYTAVKAINQDVAVSAAVMPERSVNAYYYGQDYSALAPYLDFMVAMVYKGNYNEDSVWIGTTTAYIVAHANGIPVVTGLQTYKNDTDTTPLSASELINDTQIAISNGSSGYALFRYGLIDENFYNEVAKLTVTAVDPVNNAVNVAVDKVITVTFSKPLKKGTGWIEIVTSSGTVVPSSWSISGNTLTVTPSSVLSHGVKYLLLIHTGSVTDLAGNKIAGYVSRFTTSTDVTAPTVKVVDPANNAVNVAADKVIKVTFSETIKAGNNWIELVTSNGTIVPSTWSINGKVLTVTASNTLSKGVKYLLLIHTGSVTDLAGNNVKGYVSRFTADTAAPTVKAVYSVNNAVNTLINVTFSETIKAGTGWIELQNSNGTVVPSTWSISGKALTVTTNSALSKGVNYLLLIHTGSVTDMAGNKVAGYVSRFTVDTVVPTVKSVDPANNAVSVAVNKVIKVTFSESIKAATGWIELQNSNGTLIPITWSVSGNVLTVAPNSTLSKGVNYLLLIHTGSVMDLAGNNVAGYVSRFTTASQSTSTIPAALLPYLQATKNCQSTNAQIIALSKSIINSANATTTYNKAVAIFNWVRNNIDYSFYYNTKYGAVGTLNAKTGNCVDTTHLLIALERAAGIPARYVHGYCKFSTAWYGHVWAQVYVNGKWYTADAISYRNTFGVINNWNTTTAKIYGTYATLSF